MFNHIAWRLTENGDDPVAVRAHALASIRNTFNSESAPDYSSFLFWRLFCKSSKLSIPTSASESKVDEVDLDIVEKIIGTCCFHMGLVAESELSLRGFSAKWKRAAV